MSNRMLEKINERAVVDVMSDRGSSHQVEVSVANLENDIQAWRLNGNGPVKTYRKEGDLFVLEYNPDHPLADELDRHLFNTYTTMQKDPEETIMTAQ